MAADWFDETGQPDRAEFIRCQIAASQGNDPEHEAARARAEALLEQNRNQWEEPLRALNATEVIWDRGFPNSIHLPSNPAFLQNAENIFEVAPTITSLDLHHTDLDTAGAQALAESPCLQHLTSLNLGFNDIGPAGAQALAKSPHLRHLTSLELWHNGNGCGRSTGTGGKPSLAAPYLS